ncbi:hypothetical protein [Oscillibacter sp.]|uniref:hypothetical protein n=1 Tax=Oscillibacter sp. TaxID=1945593 RepID=UPI00289E4D2C|nr:hypothetical protein [Oscillibacter sp.]
MTKKLALDDGIIELEINSNGILRFNPSDFNLYQRFCAFAKDIPEIEKQYRAAIEVSPEGGGDVVASARAKLDRVKEIDDKIKARLSAVFGGGNDFDILLGGVSLMACGQNGQFVITNLLKSLTPYLEEGARKHLGDAAGEAVAQAEKNRAQQNDWMGFARICGDRRS